MDHLQGATDSLAVRISLVPRLLLELVTHPFSDSTLVRRNGHVFVVRSGADLSGADLGDANFSGADLRETNFKGAFLARASLQEANLAGADLTHAILREANLRGANLEGANLEGCDFSYADLWGVRVDPEAMLEANVEGALLGKGDPYY
jgi:uncharacterized protein YjbI with pentapeptide repeats